MLFIDKSFNRQGCAKTTLNGMSTTEEPLLNTEVESETFLSQTRIKKQSYLLNVNASRTKNLLQKTDLQAQSHAPSSSKIYIKQVLETDSCNLRAYIANCLIDTSTTRCFSISTLDAHFCTICDRMLQKQVLVHAIKVLLTYSCDLSTVCIVLS